jgi:hypothetical protein
VGTLYNIAKRKNYELRSCFLAALGIAQTSLALHSLAQKVPFSCFIIKANLYQTKGSSTLIGVAPS